MTILWSVGTSRISRLTTRLYDRERPNSRLLRSRLFGFKYIKRNRTSILDRKDGGGWGGKHNMNAAPKKTHRGKHEIERSPKPHDTHANLTNVHATQLSLI